MVGYLAGGSQGRVFQAVHLYPSDHTPLLKPDAPGYLSSQCLYLSIALSNTVDY